MAPIDPTEAKEFYGRSGDFTSIRKLCKPGESVTVKLLDLNRNTQTKYPIKGKDYGYRLTLERQGAKLLMDINSQDLIQQIIEALYPHGPQGKLVPCVASITRRVDRKTYQSEAQVQRVEALPGGSREAESDAPLVEELEV